MLPVLKVHTNKWNIRCYIDIEEEKEKAMYQEPSMLLCINMDHERNHSFRSKELSISSSECMRVISNAD